VLQSFNVRHYIGVLKNGFELKSEQQVTGGLRSEERNDWCSSPNIIRLMKCRRMAWAGHAALTGRSDVHTEFWWRILKERD
jgi:hypothetical protein